MFIVAPYVSILGGTTATRLHELFAINTATMVMIWTIVTLFLCTGQFGGRSCEWCQLSHVLYWATTKIALHFLLEVSWYVNFGTYGAIVLRTRTISGRVLPWRVEETDDTKYASGRRCKKGTRYPACAECVWSLLHLRLQFHFYNRGSQAFPTLPRVSFRLVSWEPWPGKVIVPYWLIAWYECGVREPRVFYAARIVLEGEKCDSMYRPTKW